MIAAVEKTERQEGMEINKKPGDVKKGIVEETSNYKRNIEQKRAGI